MSQGDLSTRLTSGVVLGQDHHAWSALFWPVLSAPLRTLSATMGGVEEEDNPGYHGPQDVLRSMGFIFYALMQVHAKGGG